ncbi:membrane protein [Microbacterium phage Zooman]|nr:membrane protein [Microbacterium phage Zooman]
MNKPKGFIHREKKRWDGYRWTGENAWIIGRVRVTYAAVGALAVIFAVATTVLQVIVGVVTGWNNLVPLMVFFGFFGLVILAQLIGGLVSFIRWLAGEFSVIGPGGN